VISCLSDPAGTERLVGDPVDVVAGANLDQTLDFRLTGPLELWWCRHYDSSRSHHLGGLGRGHSHHFERALHLDADGIRYCNQTGRIVGFPPLHADWDECAKEGLLLRRLAPLRYELFAHAEPTMEFEFLRAELPAPLRRLTQGGSEIRFEYDAALLLSAIVDSVGRRVEVAVDDNGFIASLVLQARGNRKELLLIAYRYDERGNLLGTRDAAGHGYELTYDAQNRLIRRTGRSGFNFYFAYDAQGRCVRAAGDGRLHGVELVYDAAARITKVTRADSGVWNYCFDERGLTQIIDPLGGVQRFVRDERGKLIEELDPSGNATRLVYGTTGAAVAKVTSLGQWQSLPPDPNAPDPAAHRVAANAAEYHLGRLIDVTQLSLPDSTQLRGLGIWPEAQPDISLRSAPASVRPHERSFDVRPLGVLWWPPPLRGRTFSPIGKLVEQHDELEHQRAWQYDASGNVAAYTDFDGSRWSYRYGPWHFEAAIIDPLGSEVRMSYTTSGEVASFQDAAGTLSEYRYDLKDKLIEVRRHGVVRDIYRRDAAGNLVGKCASDGRELLRIEIGPGNLLAKRVLASGDEHSFIYDQCGRPTIAATSRDEIRLDYDRAGARLLEQRNGKGVAVHFARRHAPAEMVYFERFAVKYARSGRRLAIIDPGGAKHELHIMPHGLVETRFGNGSAELAQFDDRGRCLFKCARLGRGQVWRRRYHWSGEGELRLVKDSAHVDVRHEYDAAHRLRRRYVGNRLEVYEVDAADNLVSQPGLRDVTLLAGNRLGGANGWRFEYNDRNHVARRDGPAGAARYRYDSRDLLVQIESPGGAWTAHYDAFGRRSRKSWRDQTTEFFWYGDQLVAEISPAGALRLYVYADPLAQVPLLFLDYPSLDAAPNSGQRYLVFGDQIGTPCLVQDDESAEAWRAVVAPFGEVDISPTARIDFNLRFPGHYYDAETGLHCNGFRYYDPVLGRYLQSDPWGIAGGHNLYAYRPNPLLQVDVRGLGEENKKKGLPCPDEEENKPKTPNPQDLDEKFGPATEPWLRRPGEGEFPLDAQIVKPGGPVDIKPYNTPDGKPGRYVYIVTENGNMIIAPEHGTSTSPDGSARTTKHTDLAQNGPARVSGEINPTNDPNVWIMNDDSGRYSMRRANPGEPTNPRGLVDTRSPDNLRNANSLLDSANTGGTTVTNEADLYGDQHYPSLKSTAQR
jgi:RHS repeat-associated protein